MEYKANYTVVGLFVIIMSTALLAIALWLSVGLEAKSYDIYEVFMNEPVSGLTEQAPVKFNGVTVGNVKEIRLNKLNPQQVSLLLEIEHNAPITTSTVATLLSQGITGVTYIGLSARKAIAPPLVAKAGQHYPVIPSQPSLLVQLDKSLRDITEGVKEVASSINELLNQQNKQAIHRILHNTAIFSSKLPELSTKLGAAGSSVTTTMQQGDKVLKNISIQAVPPAVSLIQRMDNIAINLEQLSRELNNNPAIILSGKAKPKLGPGEH